MRGAVVATLAIALHVAIVPPAVGEYLRFVTEEFAPFSTRQNGSVEGPGSDVARMICRDLNLECTFEALPLRRAIEIVEAGKADAVFSLARTSERDATMRFTRPYIRSGYAFFTRKDRNYVVVNRRSFAGFTVAAYGPSGTYTSLEAVQREAPSIKLAQEVSFETPFLKLLEGRYPEPAAVYANWHVGLLWLQGREIKTIAVSFPEKFVDYCFAFSRQAPAAVRNAAAFDAALGAMRRDGRLLALLSPYAFADSDMPSVDE